jgi:hypothetical protein
LNSNQDHYQNSKIKFNFLAGRYQIQQEAFNIQKTEFIFSRNQSFSNSEKEEAFPNESL